MTETEILSRSDCFNCGAEATYEKVGEDSYRVECVNIDCPVSQSRLSPKEEAESFPSDQSINPQITVPNLCYRHLHDLVQMTIYKPTDTWRALTIAAQIALFQAATTDDFIQEKLEGDITRISELGCLACLKSDAFNQIVEAGKSHDIGKIKALGEKWVNDAKKDVPTRR